MSKIFETPLYPYRRSADQDAAAPKPSGNGVQVYAKGAKYLLISHNSPSVSGYAKRLNCPQRTGDYDIRLGP